MNDFEYLCPVPKDQRPLNEYTKLKESNNFLWCIQDKNSYLQFLAIIFIVSFILSALTLVISSFSLTNIKYFFISCTHLLDLSCVKFFVKLRNYHISTISLISIS